MYDSDVYQFWCSSKFETFLADNWLIALHYNTKEMLTAKPDVAFFCRGHQHDVRFWYIVFPTDLTDHWSHNLRLELVLLNFIGPLDLPHSAAIYVACICL